MNYSLANIFAKQRQLMTALEPVEISLGYNPCPVPLDFTQRSQQDWFRLMSWYLTEELVEMTIAPVKDKPEELADCLHFMVELCLLAGVEYRQVTFALDMGLYDPEPELGPFSVIVQVGKANNLLKAKHWKKEPKPADMDRFRYSLIQALITLLRMFQVQGLNPEEEYMKKHTINEGRIQSGY